jgi:hypothetical protein
VRRDFQPNDPDGIPVFRIDVQTGRRELWRRFTPSEYARGAELLPIVIGRDGQSYAYTFACGVSDLYLLEGLK